MGTGFTGSGLLGRLYRGENRFNFIASRKKWYLASAVIITICVLSIIFRGFAFGIDFAGGDSYSLSVKPGVTLSQVRAAVESTGVTVESAQTAGSGKTETFVINTETNDPQTVQNIKTALVRAGHLTNTNEVNNSQVSKSWGGEVTKDALIALVVFLIAVSIFISVRFQEWRMALAALLALFHDLLLTAGVYSLVGFEVSPATIVGLLTILGFSLYDTVVVFDKVAENSKGLLAATRYTYPEAANLAVNQTLMRSINTSLIGLLPVAGLLFVGAGLLGVGTLEDLALVLFVGMLTGAYSSLFLATPWLVDFKLMDPRYKNHTARVLARRQAAKSGAAEGAAGKRRPAPARKAAAGRADVDTEEDDREDALAGSASGGTTASSAPRVGAKPTASKRTQGGRPSGNRPGGGNRRR